MATSVVSHSGFHPWFPDDFMAEESRVEVEKNSEVAQVEVEKKSEPTGYVYCPICRDVVKSQGRHAHFSNSHPKEDYDEYKDKFEEAPAPKRHLRGRGEGMRSLRPDG